MVQYLDRSCSEWVNIEKILFQTFRYLSFIVSVKASNVDTKFAYLSYCFIVHIEQTDDNADDVNVDKLWEQKQMMVLNIK